ncbi:hypothetical protein [Vibrio phage VP4B]|uniref:Uncharacterized protein n=1 Tax=Vibrio phage VP4B TaxID=1262540 RepID=V9LZN1_9CAUD|nr:hypothetical protein FDJ61_gp036 [Vibrio phage VP4B]AGB07150.1 hypothetical protein [Vibrio phage VP4B]
MGHRGNFFADSKETVSMPTVNDEYNNDRVKIIKAPSITPDYVKADGTRIKPDYMAMCGSTALIFRHTLDPKDWLALFDLEEFKEGVWERELIHLSVNSERIAKIFYRIEEEFFEVDFRGNELRISQPLTYAIAGSGADVFEGVMTSITGNKSVTAYDVLLVLKLVLRSEVEETIGGNVRALFTGGSVVQEIPNKLDPDEQKHLRDRYEKRLYEITGLTKPEVVESKETKPAKKAKKKPKKETKPKETEKKD